jgi:copper chaperone NosL
MLKNKTLTYCISALLLLLISLPLPFWTVIMTAPTYPLGNLSMRVYLNFFEGDLREWNTVGNLVGVKVPPPIPEITFTIVPILMGLLIFGVLIACFKPQILKIISILPWVLITVLTIYTQYSLYIFGHDLDPTRPLRYIEPFTPPVIGWKKIGTLMTYHLPHIGSFLLVGAGVLLYFANKNYQVAKNSVTTN